MAVHFKHVWGKTLREPAKNCVLKAESRMVIPIRERSVDTGVPAQPFHFRRSVETQKSQSLGVRTIP